jgi:hypothetical protein
LSRNDLNVRVPSRRSSMTPRAVAMTTSAIVGRTPMAEPIAINTTISTTAPMRSKNRTAITR